MQRDDLENLIKGALDLIAKENPKLPLDNRIGERPIVSRLAFHLNNLISIDTGLIVDVEYNINSTGGRKFLDADENLKSAAEKVYRKIYEDDRIIVVPDIVIHKRSTDDKNCAVIEVKFGDAGKREFKYAELKLKAFQRAPFEYKYGILVSIPRNWNAFSNNTKINFK